MSESSQQKLSRNRPPRVQITYDVEIGSAIEKKEIPFVMGILSNLSGYGVGRPDERGEPLKSRTFVEIDRDNFAAVMAQINPKVSITIADAQDPESDPEKVARLPLTLSFQSMDDFSPDRLVEQIGQEGKGGKSIKQLSDERKALRDLLTKLDGNDELLKALRAAADPANRDAVSSSTQESLTALTDARRKLDS